MFSVSKPLRLAADDPISDVEREGILPQKQTSVPTLLVAETATFSTKLFEFRQRQLDAIVTTLTGREERLRTCRFGFRL